MIMSNRPKKVGVATVELSFSALPAHVRTARLVAAAVARRSGVDEAVLDEVRLAVGEACSRAVHLHRRHCPERPVQVTLTDDVQAFRVVVSDEAPSDDSSDGDQPRRARPRTPTSTSTPRLPGWGWP